MLEIQILVWDRHKNILGLSRLMRFPPRPPLDNWISNEWQYIYKQTIENLHRFTSTQNIISTL